MFGNGAGGFGAPKFITYASTYYPHALGDFNGDGRVDLLTMLTDGFVVMVGGCN